MKNNISVGKLNSREKPAKKKKPKNQIHQKEIRNFISLDNSEDTEKTARNNFHKYKLLIIPVLVMIVAVVYGNKAYKTHIIDEIDAQQDILYDMKNGMFNEKKFYETSNIKKIQLINTLYSQDNIKDSIKVDMIKSIQVDDHIIADIVSERVMAADKGMLPGLKSHVLENSISSITSMFIGDRDYKLKNYISAIKSYNKSLMLVKSDSMYKLIKAKILMTKVKMRESGGDK